MLLQANEKLVMIGDSITDCGRNPQGEGLFEAIGKGYVALVEALIHTSYPERHIRVINKGNSGNTVLDLKSRWEQDVLALKPDWLSIMIGINDVWRQFDQPMMTESHVYIHEYEQTLIQLVKQTRPTVKGLVLMTPFYIEPNDQDAMRATMDLYGEAVRRVAEAHDCFFVDVQAALTPILEHIYPATLAWDRVHPNQIGHMTIARAFLDSVGYEFNRR
jgi:lysophospholipase L1-like esterase